MASHFDAIVIGGGPAGGIAALELSRLGWRVLLVERKRRHREKACGHCLAPRGVSLLRSLGLGQRLQRLARGRMIAFRLHVPGINPLEMDIDAACAGARSIERHPGTEQCVAPERGMIVRRDELDQMLLDAAAEAGAMVMQPASARIESYNSRGASAVIHVNGPIPGKAGDRMTQRMAAPLVIGADGLAGRTAQGAGLAAPRRSSRRYGFSLTLPEHGAASHLERDVVHMFAATDGYLGLVREGLSRCHLAALVRSDRDKSISPWEFVKRMTRTFPQIGCIESVPADSLAIHASGPMPARPAAVANERVALVGDAAGYIEPFSGEGMTWAIESAVLLARTLRRHGPGTWNRQIADEYARAWAEAIEPRQRRCAWISRWLDHPALVAATCAIGRPWPCISRRLVRQVLAA